MPWTVRRALLRQTLKVSRALQGDDTHAVAGLTERVRDAILNGTGEDPLPSPTRRRPGYTVTNRSRACCRNLQRRWQETTVSGARGDVAHRPRSPVRV